MSFNTKWSIAISKSAGFTQLPNLLFENQGRLRINSSELITLIHIIRWQNINNLSTVSLRDVARHTRTSHSTQSRIVKQLSKKKLIKRNFRTGETTEYSLRPLVERLEFLIGKSTQNRTPPLPKKASKPYSNMSTNNKPNKFKERSRDMEARYIHDIVRGGRYEHLRR